MKTTIFIVVVLALGVAAGIGIAKLRVGNSAWTPPAQEQEPGQPAAGPTAPPAGAPKVVIDATSFDFGTAYGAAEGSHDFAFSNGGSSPLHLVVRDVSGPAITVTPDDVEIPPRGSGKLTLAWRSSDISDSFQQTVKILTNDPARGEVTLVLSGHIKAALQAVPFGLLFRKLAVGTGTTGTAQLFCYADQPLKILGYTWSDAAIGQYFNVALEPMAGDELKKDPAAKSGVRVTVAVKPGLPPGLFRQGVVLKTNLKTPAEFVLPMVGVVESDIVIAGRGWEPSEGILSLGTISGKAGHQARLMLMVHGAHRQQIKFKPASVTPSFLKVSLGQSAEVDKGAIVQTPLLIAIPPGSPSVNFLGWNQGPLGEVVLETTHPQIPKLRIAVRMAVEN